MLKNVDFLNNAVNVLYILMHDGTHNKFNAWWNTHQGYYSN